MKVAKIIKIFGEIDFELEEDYEYQIVTSTGPKSLYKMKGKKHLSDDEYKTAHEKHILEDYLEDEFEVLLTKTTIKNYEIQTKLLIRKRK